MDQPLAGLTYGTSGIPSHWISKLVRSKDIIRLANVLNKAIKT